MTASSFVFLCLFLQLQLLGSNGDVAECPNESNYPATVCPSQSTCCAYQYSNNGYGCSMPNVSNPSLNYCCAPGALFNESDSLPNVMIMGDSVSIGYTYAVVTNLSTEALVQHSPWDTRNGGASNTSYGLSCLPIFLKGVQQQSISWDLIQFNFGLHDLDNSSSAEASYAEQLTNITQQLLSWTAPNGKKPKIIYALTTPQMQDYNEGNHAVEDLNAIASNIMNNYSVPIVDLYQRVVDFCGPVPYVNCSICKKEPCQFHYTTQGYEWISVPVNNAIREYLNLPPGVNSNNSTLS